MNRPYIVLTVMVVMVGAPLFAAHEALAEVFTITAGNDALLGTDGATTSRVAVGTTTSTVGAATTRSKAAAATTRSSPAKATTMWTLARATTLSTRVTQTGWIT